MNASFLRQRCTCCDEDLRASNRHELRVSISARCRPDCQDHHLRRHFAHAIAHDVPPSFDGAPEYGVAWRGARLRQNFTRLRSGVAIRAEPSLATRAGDTGAWWKRPLGNAAYHHRIGPSRRSLLHFRPITKGTLRQLQEDNRTGTSHRCSFGAVLKRKTCLTLAGAPSRKQDFAFLVPTPRDARQRNTKVVGRAIQSTLDGIAGSIPA